MLRSHDDADDGGSKKGKKTITDRSYKVGNIVSSGASDKPTIQSSKGRDGRGRHMVKTHELTTMTTTTTAKQNLIVIDTDEAQEKRVINIDAEVRQFM